MQTTLLVVLACCLAAPVPAQVAVPAPAAARATPASVQQIEFPESKVMVHTWSSWPDMAYQGQLPLRFLVRNDDDREHEVALQLARGYSQESTIVLEHVRVGPGASAELEVCVPVGLTFAGNGYNVQAT